MSAFPRVGASSDARARLGVLYRVETAPDTGWNIILVQSHEEPKWGVLPGSYLIDTCGGVENPDTKQVDTAYASLRSGMILGFRLRANPTKKICAKTGPDGVRRNGKRVELRGDENIVRWLSRKGDQMGFRLQDVHHDDGVSAVRAAQEAKLKGRRTMLNQGDTSGERHSITIATVLFEGILQITDTEKFMQALDEGIGPGKAYGCGLLSVRPVQQGD